MRKKISLSDEERADLIAYLDGELHGEAARAMEKRLGHDKAYRKEAEALKQAWDLLDYLPRAEPSPNFTHRTISRLQPVQTQPARLSLWRRWRTRILGASWAAALVLAFFGGYSAYQFFAFRHPDDADLVGDLRVIENKRLYELGESIDFIRELGNRDLFGDDHSGS